MFVRTYACVFLFVHTNSYVHALSASIYVENTRLIFNVALFVLNICFLETLLKVKEKCDPETNLCGNSLHCKSCTGNPNDAICISGTIIYHSLVERFVKSTFINNK